MSLLFVHGGVSGLEKDQPSLSHAIDAGTAGDDALLRVELAVCALEDDPNTNAGYGSVLSISGLLEMDAGIADGSTGSTGAVSLVTVRHPISLARRVMEKTPHAYLAGAGAMAFAADMELLADTSPAQRERWEKAVRDQTLTPESYGTPAHVDTVGAVALDEDGRLVAGSSTGGVFGKMDGRIGDAPVFGGGFYASKGAAVVGTGVGELFIRSLASLRAAMLIEAGADPQDACERVLREVALGKGVTAGLLALDPEGRVGAAFVGGSLAMEGVDGPVDARRLS